MRGQKGGDYSIPFANGCQVHYAYNGEAGIRWLPNFEFKATLVLDNMHRGRSAAYFTFRDEETNKSVVVFMKDFMEMFQHSCHGKVKGTFTFIKRGQNYGCRRIGD